MKSLFFTLFSLAIFSTCLAQSSEECIKNGMIALKAKKFPDALDYFDKAIKLNSKAPLAYYGRGLTKSYTGDFRNAITDFSTALTFKSDSVFRIYVARGKAKEASLDFSGATEDLDKAIELNPLSQEPFFCRARVNMALKDYHSAVRDADQAISLNSEFADAYLLRGLAKQSLNQKQSACNDFNKAQQLGSNQAAFAIRQYCN